jgi:hypothetical protein
VDSGDAVHNEPLSYESLKSRKGKQEDARTVTRLFNGWLFVHLSLPVRPTEFVETSASGTILEALHRALSS